VSCVKTILKLH